MRHQTVPFLLTLLAVSHALAAEVVLNPGLAGRTLLIRQRAFKAGAPAGYTNVPYLAGPGDAAGPGGAAGAVGASFVNARPPAVQAALRLVDAGTDQVFPVEPRLAARGPLDDWTRAQARLDDARAELARTRVANQAELERITAELRDAANARAGVQSRLDAIFDVQRVVGRELRRRPDDADARAHLAELNREQVKLMPELLKRNLEHDQLTRRRDALAIALDAGRGEAEGRLRDERAALAGFYVGEAMRGVGCARPLVFAAGDDVAVNPFYPRADLKSELKGTRLAVCVSEGRLHATYLFGTDGAVLATALYGRDASGRIDRVVLRDSAGALIEDHQYLPGPNQAVRYGLTFRDARQRLTSVYVDLN